MTPFFVLLSKYCELIKASVTECQLEGSTVIQKAKSFVSNFSFLWRSRWHSSRGIQSMESGDDRKFNRSIDKISSLVSIGIGQLMTNR